MRKNIKRTAKLLLLSIFVFINGICTNISAEESEKAYYTNYYGVELTKTEYDNLSKGFDQNNNPVNPTSLVSPLAADIWESEYSYPVRKLKVTISAEGELGSKRVVSVTNTWIVLPAVRSFDVLAVRVEGDYTLWLNSENTYGHQFWDGNRVDYDRDKCPNYFNTFSDGVGLSMNLSDKATQYIECMLVVCVGSGADDILAVGTYQHAAETTTLDQSKKYTIDILGYGGVVDFSSSVRKKYEQGAGLIVQDVE